MWEAYSASIGPGKVQLNMVAEGDDLLLRVKKNCELLHKGYQEKVDYKLRVAYHRLNCTHYGKTSLPKECACPVSEESRTKHINRPGLLEQLQAFAANKDTDRNAKAERGAPRVKVAGRPPGDMAGFFAYDEIVCDILRVVDQVMEEAGRDRTWASESVLSVLRGLTEQVKHFVDSRPDQARTIDLAASRWVRSARSALMITPGDSIFETVTCGNCGGGLATPWGNRGEAEVRCVGTPVDPPCGHTYPMSEWIKLYEGGRS